jgi:hypothetical protein
MNMPNKVNKLVERLLGEVKHPNDHTEDFPRGRHVSAEHFYKILPIGGVEPQEGDTHVEATVREVLQLGVDGMEDLLVAGAADIESNQEELTNFDAPAFVGHLRAAAAVLQNATGA